MTPIQLMEAAGLSRTANTNTDTTLFLKSLRDSDNLEKVIQVSETLTKNNVFYNYYSNYNTEIGEVAEEIVAKKFTDIIPKTYIKIGHKGRKSQKKSPEYIDFNKKHNKKPSNYDLLVEYQTDLRSIEVKAIRAATSKQSFVSKIDAIPSPLVERGLSFTDDASLMGNISFQQTKPAFFDYLIGLVIYIDQIDFYVVPSADIISGKLTIMKQHGGASTNEDGTNVEGHLLITSLADYKIMSVYNEEDLFKTEELSSYIGKYIQ